MKIYTRTGDDGGTALFGGQRTSKSDQRVGAYGAVDSANSAVGLAAASAAAQDDPWQTRLRSVMSDLFDLGAELATPPAADAKLKSRLTTAIGADHIGELEAWIDEAQAQLPALKTFVLPTGTELSARFHVARSEVRRAEREVVALRETGTPVRDEVLHYLNRLSDLLFVWSRVANWKAGAPDVPWSGRKAPELT